ncbi:sensor histidine kinase [Larkinella sp. C7]|uniref:sensor histidine kinase n=1 Tax=Larkinella sp. C7 TaxID=2576607 RepID=UPI001E3E005D|nr:ATP-binding protein [Larkinella sp. C7]
MAWRENQPQAATVQAEVLALVPQLQDQREVGWAMARLSELMSQPNGDKLAPVLAALGETMSRATLNGREGNRVPRPGNPQSIKIPFRTTSSPFQRTFGTGVTPDEVIRVNLRASGHFTERWLDSLVRRRDQPSADVKQLTEKKKIRDSSQQLSQRFAQRGDYAQAYNYYVQYTAYKDNLAAEVTARQVADLQFRQVAQKKETQIKLLTTERQLSDQQARQQRQVLFAVLGLAGLLLAFSITLIRANRQRRRANRQLNEQKETLETTLSELKTTQNQLIQSEKMAALGELTAGIAHEIQNPLNFVNNFSEVSAELVEELTQLHEEEKLDHQLQAELLTDLKQNLQKISQHGARASTILKGMLEHSRTITGEREPTDLNRLVEEHLLMAYHTIQAKCRSFEAKLITQFDPQIGTINVAQQEISRVLLNLFNNSFYALEQKRTTDSNAFKPEIVVQTSRAGQQVSLKVWDNGTGIPASVRAKIFQPFFTTKPTGQGTGLGLSLSYDIITKGYGGTLTVLTEVGTFTEFTVTLPLSETSIKSARVQAI